MAQPKVRQVELEYPKVFKMPNTHIEVKISVHLAIYKAMGLKMNFLQIENLQSHSPHSSSLVSLFLRFQARFSVLT